MKFISLISLTLFAFVFSSLSPSLQAQETDPRIARDEAYYTTIDSLLDLKKISDAITVSDQLIAFTIEAFGKTDTAYADALAMKSECLIYAKKYADAITIQEEVLAIRRTIPGEESSIVSSLNTLWQLNRYQGQYARAEQFMMEAISVQEKISPVCKELITLHGNLGLHYRETGNFQKSESAYLKALQIGQQLFGGDNIESAFIYNNIGSLYRNMGNLNQAEYYFLKFYNVIAAKNGKTHPKTASALNNLAMVNEDMGNDAKAEEYFLAALDIDISTDTAGYISALGNIAVLYSRKLYFEKAEAYYLQSLALQKSYMPGENANLATILYNLGSLYLQKKDYSSARTYFMQCLEMRKRLFGESHHSIGSCILGLSKADFYEGKYAECVQQGKIAKAILENTVGNKHTFYENAIFTLGDFYQKQNMLDSAEGYYLEGLHLQYYQIRQQFSFMGEMERELYLKKVNNRSSILLQYFLDRKASNPAITGEAYNYALNTKGLLLKSSSTMRNAILNGDNQELKDQYDAWIALKKKINTLYNTPLDKRKEDPEQLEEKANALEKELVRSVSGLENNQDIMNHSWLEVKAKLKKQEAAVEFIHFKKTVDSTLYCALILTSETEYPEMIPLFEEKELSAILGTNNSNDYKLINTVYGTKTKKNAALYELIWEPLEMSLGKTKKVYVSPSGLLHKVAFSALSKKDGSYLAEKLALSVVSTSNEIGQSTELIITPDTKISLFGGIQYSADSANSYPWQYLSGTKTESDALYSSFKTYTQHLNYMTGEKATKTNFMELAKNSSILHIATHGFFFPDPVEAMNLLVDTTEKADIQFRSGPTRASTLYVNNQNPLMRSGLVFAGANDYWSSEGLETENNGVLTALDVVNIDLRKNKLVVMSACESGLGDVIGGEGVYGLQRAFKMAGTDFIIMSLWQVPDKETAEFMQTFYTLLFEQKDIELAFAGTQKLMRKKYDPYFWAAFVLLR